MAACWSTSLRHRSRSRRGSKSGGGRGARAAAARADGARGGRVRAARRQGDRRGHQCRSVERVARTDRLAARRWAGRCRHAPRQAHSAREPERHSSPAIASISPASIICCRVSRSKATSRCSKRSVPRQAGRCDDGCSICSVARRWTSRRSSIARLNDERWYVQRNMLMLLARGRTRAGDVLGRAVDAASRCARAIGSDPSAADAAARARPRRRCRRSTILTLASSIWA